MHLRFLMSLLAVAGCDRTTTGERVIEFTPDDCGALAYTTTLSSGFANAEVGPNPSFTRADFDPYTIRLELATGPARTIEIIAD